PEIDPKNKAYTTIARTTTNTSTRITDTTSDKAFTFVFFIFIIGLSINRRYGDMVDYSPDSVIIHLLFDIYQINSFFFCGYGQLEENYSMLKTFFKILDTNG